MQRRGYASIELLVNMFTEKKSISNSQKSLSHFCGNMPGLRVIHLLSC